MQISEIVHKYIKSKHKIDSSFVQKQLIKLYFKSPPKVQFALARFGIKAVMNKNKEELEELIRH